MVSNQTDRYSLAVVWGLALSRWIPTTTDLWKSKVIMQNFVYYTHRNSQLFGNHLYCNSSANQNIVYFLSWVKFLKIILNNPYAFNIYIYIYIYIYIIYIYIYIYNLHFARTDSGLCIYLMFKQFPVNHLVHPVVPSLILFLF